MKLAVEIDGISHIDKEEYDKHRDAVLEAFGLKILHFDDQTVLNNFQFIENSFREIIHLRKKELGLK